MPNRYPFFKLFCLVFMLLLCSTAVQAMSQPPPPKQAVNITFEATLSSGLPAVIELGADWCPACRALKPIMKKLSEENKGKMIFLQVNTDTSRDLAWEYQVTVIPTILFFNKEGELKGRYSGFMSREQILKAIEYYKLAE